MTSASKMSQRYQWSHFFLINKILFAQAPPISPHTSVTVHQSKNNEWKIWRGEEEVAIFCSTFLHVGMCATCSISKSVIHRLLVNWAKQKKSTFSTEFFKLNFFNWILTESEIDQTCRTYRQNAETSSQQKEPNTHFKQSISKSATSRTSISQDINYRHRNPNFDI